MSDRLKWHSHSTGGRGKMGNTQVSVSRKRTGKFLNADPFKRDDENECHPQRDT